MKPFRYKRNIQGISVAEVVPLKQGLKLHIHDEVVLEIPGCRGSSIKTRIETGLRGQFFQCSQLVAEVVPLKQGLKQSDLEAKKINYNKLQR